MENSSYLGFRGESKVYHNKLGLNTTRNLITTSPRWAHWWYELNVFNLLKDLVLDPIEPSSVIHPLPKEFQRRLWSISVFFGHVKVIDVDNHFFTIRNHFSFSSSSHFSFDHVLCFFAGCLWGENNVGDFPRVLIELRKNLVDEDCFTSTSDTDTESMNFIIYT